MSKVLRELQQDKRSLLAELQELQTRTTSESRAMTSDEDAQFDKVNDKLTELDGKIARQQKLEERMKEIASQQEPPKLQDDQPTADYREVFWKYKKRGAKALTRAERKVLETRGTDTQTSTDADHGINLVPEDFGDQIITTMKHYSGILEAANIIRTTGGNPLPFPTLDDTSVKGSRIGEGTADTVNDLTYGAKQLDAYTYTSNVIKWSYELLQDNAFDLASHTNQVASERLGRILNEEMTTSDGSSKPNGILNAASTGLTADATGAITRDEIVDFIYSVDRAYRPNGTLMMHDSTVAAIRKLSFGSGDDRPLYQAGNAQLGEPATIEGFQYIVNNDFDQLSDGASSNVMAFGDWSRFYVRIARGMELKRLDERYADERVVAFFMFLRADSELMDNSAIKLLTTAAS